MQGFGHLALARFKMLGVAETEDATARGAEARCDKKCLGNGLCKCVASRSCSPSLALQRRNYVQSFGNAKPSRPNLRPLAYNCRALPKHSAVRSFGKPSCCNTSEIRLWPGASTHICVGVYVILCMYDCVHMYVLLGTLHYSSIRLFFSEA